jgi:hypothetical protein
MNDPMTRTQKSQPAASPASDTSAADPRMTRDELAHIVSCATGKTVSGKTLLNKKLLGEASHKGGGRRNKSKWDYLKVKPALEKEFGVPLPDLPAARASLASSQSVELGVWQWKNFPNFPESFPGKV